MTTTEHTDLGKLDPMTRCFALVGRFLHAWASMESSLHEAIGEALVIEARRLQILCANMGFRDKLNVLSTLIDVAPNFAVEEKQRIRKRIGELAEPLSGRRNIMVHNPFGPDSSQKGVEFLRVKARGKFETPNEVWDEAHFNGEVASIESHQAFLVDLASLFRAQPLPSQSYSAALQRFMPYEAGWVGRPMGIPEIMKLHMSPAPEVFGKPDEGET